MRRGAQRYAGHRTPPRQRARPGAPSRRARRRTPGRPRCRRSARRAPRRGCRRRRRGRQRRRPGPWDAAGARRHGCDHAGARERDKDASCTAASAPAPRERDGPLVAATIAMSASPARSAVSARPSVVRLVAGALAASPTPRCPARRHCMRRPYRRIARVSVRFITFRPVQAAVRRMLEAGHRAPRSSPTHRRSS